MGVCINKAELLKELSVIPDRPVRSAMQIIKILPTIDLIRCGECKWGNKDNEGTLWCEHAIGGIMKPTDFCSYGERRNDER